MGKFKTTSTNLGIYSSIPQATIQRNDLSIRKFILKTTAWLKWQEYCISVFHKLPETWNITRKFNRALSSLISKYFFESLLAFNLDFFFFICVFFFWKDQYFLSLTLSSIAKGLIGLIFTEGWNLEVVYYLTFKRVLQLNNKI